MTNERQQKVIIIGAGLGGLSAAISLASSGFRVQVFEKNDKVGGKLNVLVREGFTLDLGPSILLLPHVFQELFRRAGRKMEDYVSTQEVVPHWRNFFEGGTTIDLTPDMRQMELELAKLPEGESIGFYRFLEYSRVQWGTTEAGYLRHGLDSLGDVLRFYGPIRSFLLFDVVRSMDAGVARLIRNEKLRDILDYFVKYVGSSPYDAPTVMNMLPYSQFGYGLWYVKGGMCNLARGMERLARELGVSITLNTEVASIGKTGSSVDGVVLKDGSSHRADIIVSNMEVIPAHTKLLGADRSVLKRYSRFAPSCSGLVIHLGVDRQYPQLAHHNFFYSGDSRRHFRAVFHQGMLSDDPTIYLVAPTRTDPTQAPAGCDVIKALPHIPHIRDTQPYTSEDYARYRDGVLGKLERMGLTDLRKHVVAEETWTPIDIQARYFSNKGSIYGVVSDRFRNLGFRAPKRSREFRNLYFVGGSVNPGAGMPMVTLSGMLAADMIARNAAG